MAMRQRAGSQLRMIAITATIIVGLTQGACTAGTTPAEPDTGESDTATSAPGGADTGGAEPGPTTPGPATQSPTSFLPTEPVPETLAWGPTQQQLDAAIAQVATWPVEKAAGTVLMASFPGTQAPVALIEQLHLGGLIVMGRNVEDPAQLSGLAAQAKAAGVQLISVDNEGGLVQRLKAPGWTSVPAFCHAGGAPASVVSGAMAVIGAETRASGLNFVLAPVADVTAPGDVTIKTRAAGTDPAVVGEAVTAALAGFAQAGVISSLKHFPGHGSLAVDSHQGLPVLTATGAELERELKPFAVGIDAGAPAVMMGHIAVADWDTGVAASLSPAAYAYLREELGFTGVAITDGLDMAALTDSYDSAQIAVKALQAGADLLLGPVDPVAAHQGIVAAVAAGELDRQRLNEAAGRVVALTNWQQELAMRSDKAGAGAPTFADIGSPAHVAAAQAFKDEPGSC